MQMSMHRLQNRKQLDLGSRGSPFLFVILVHKQPSVDASQRFVIERDNGNVHRAAAKDIVFKSRAARGSVCNVLLSRDYDQQVSR